MLLHARAQIDKRDRFGGFAALHWAVAGAKADAVALLLKMKANLKVATPTGDTALMMAKAAVLKPNHSEAAEETLQAMDSFIETERLRLHRLKVKHSHMYGTAAPDSTENDDSEFAGVAAAAVAQEQDPDREFRVALDNPDGHAILEAKLLDARVDGRMSAQEVPDTKQLPVQRHFSKADASDLMCAAGNGTATGIRRRSRSFPQSKAGGGACNGKSQSRRKCRDGGGATTSSDSTCCFFGTLQKLNPCTWRVQLGHNIHLCACKLLTIRK